MFRNLIASLAVCFAFSCAQPTDANGDGIADGIKSADNISVVAPANPVGSVSGIVANSKFVGIEGAAVTLTLGGRSEDGMGKSFSANTAADGSYSFQKVPAGSNGFISVSKAGFGLARTTVNVPSSAGNVPLNNGNASSDLLILTELNYTAKFTVLTSTGRAAKGAKAVIEVTPSATRSSGSGTYGSSIGVTTVESSVDDNGVLQFAGIPAPMELARLGGTYQLYIGAIDDDKDGRPEFIGTAPSYSGQTLFINPVQQIILASGSGTAALRVVASTIDRLANAGLSAPLANDVKPSDVINVVFNQAIVDSVARKVTVVAEDCLTPVNATVTMKAPNIMAIAPMSSWSDGAKHNLSIRVTSAETGETRDFVTYFFALDPTMPKTVSSTVTFQVKKPMGAMMDLDKLKTGDRLFITFNSPLTNLGGPGGRVFANFDINMNGMNLMNMDPYEFGSPFTSGWSMSANEVLSDPNGMGTFSCIASSYSSRFEVALAGLPLAGIPFGTSFKVVIPKDSSGQTGYQSAWGQSVTGDFTGPLSAAP